MLGKSVKRLSIPAHTKIRPGRRRAGRSQAARGEAFGEEAME
jgi:hypothetical protein